MRELRGWLLWAGSFPLLALTALLLVVVRSGSGGGDWAFFVSGSQLLLGEPAVVGHDVRTGQPRLASRPGGLEIYANYPFYQIGPLALLLARLFLLVSPEHALGLSQITMMLAAALVLAWLLSSRSPLVLGGSRLSPPRRLLAAGVALVGFSEVVVRWAHIDDGLALLCLILASVGLLRACRSRTLSASRSWPIALALAVALGSKPWCLPLMLLPLLLVALAQRVGPPRAALLALEVRTLALAALVWLPFVIAAPDSLAAGGGTTLIAPDSTLALLGLSGPTPALVRALQLAAALLLLGVLVLRARAAASPALLLGGALLVVVVARIGGDPVTNSYFLGGLLLAAFLFDVLADHPLPRASLLGAVLLLPIWPLLLDGHPSAAALVRAALLLVLLGFALLPVRTRARSRS